MLPEDRGAQNLIVLCSVIQLPFSEYQNVKSNPPKGHYGFACFMYKEYVRAILDIQFRKQVILDHTGYVVQLAHQEYCNSKEIAGAIGIVWQPTPVDYPILNFDEIRFKLEDGVIISVFKSSIPMVKCDSQGIVQSNLSPPSSYNPPPPQAAPPKDTPVNQLIPLTSPYEGEDDSGNTYVRDIPPPPDANENTGYKISVSYTQQSPSGSPTPISYDIYACGPVSYDTQAMSGFPGREQLFITARSLSQTPVSGCGDTPPVTRYESDNFIVSGSLQVNITKIGT